MSIVMHNLRVAAMKTIMNLLKKHKTIPAEDLKIEVMLRHNVSEYTAEKYLRETVKIGVAIVDDNYNLIYHFDQRIQKFKDGAGS